MTGYFYRVIRDKPFPNEKLIGGRIEWTSTDGYFNSGRFLLPVKFYLKFKDMFDYRRSKEKLYIRLDMNGGKMIRKNSLKALPKAKDDEFNL